MLKFISFGSGSSGNCYLLYTETASILIDSGVGIRTLKKRFGDYGIDLSNCMGILITHDHADHIKSVGSLSGDCCLPVYTTREVHYGITRNYCVKKKLRAGFDRNIEKGVRFQIGPFSITPFHVPHDSTDNVGYFVEYEEVTFCLMTDIGHVTDEMKQYISRSRYLVIEANHEVEKLMNGPYPQYLKERITSPRGHLSNVDCAIAIAENATPELSHVWLAHLSEENNHPELARKTIEGKLRTYGIVAGKDFEMDILKRNSASEIYNLV